MRKLHRRAIPVLLLPLMLTACVGSKTSTIHQESTQVPSATLTRSSPPSPTATTHLDPVVASIGRVTGVASIATGSVSSVRFIPLDSDRLQVEVTIDSAQGSDGNVLVAATAATSNTCKASGHAIVLGSASPGSSSFVAIMPRANFYEDWSPYKYIFLTQRQASSACDLLSGTPGTIAWNEPASLKHLSTKDEGPTYGARGGVQKLSSGALTYDVHSGDILENIANRFGLDTDELLWLTPFRPRGDDGLAYNGEVFNLSPSFR